MDEPLADQLAATLLHRWSVLGTLPDTTPRQLLRTPRACRTASPTRRSSRLPAEPDRAWRPFELVDDAVEHGTPPFLPGHGFQYPDTGYVITGILVEQVMGRPPEAEVTGVGPAVTRRSPKRDPGPKVDAGQIDDRFGQMFASPTRHG